MQNPGWVVLKKIQKKKSFQTYPTQDAEYLHWVVNTGFIIFCNSSKKPTYRKNTFNITIE